MRGFVGGKIVLFPKTIAIKTEELMAINSKRLEKSVGVQAYNRPIKVAYFVPTAEETRTHWILDAIFYESYTRWGGTNTLVLPTNFNGFANESYENWLQAFDPDFVYSYVELEPNFIKKVSALCLPISFLVRPKRRDDSPETRWRDLSPDWAHYFNSVKSLSTLLSPYANPERHNRPSPSAVKTLLTQSVEPSDDRFLPDNFGVSHDVSMYTNPVPGLFETACYVGPQKAGFKAGTREIHSTSSALAEIASGNVYTFATLARVHTESLNRVESYPWSRGFLLFVGETCNDRVNFWNSRLLIPRWIDNPGSLLVKKTLFEDESFIKELGNYLNKFNFQRGNGPPTVELRSLSENNSELDKIQKKMHQKSWSQFSVPANFNALVCPTEKEISEARISRRNAAIFRLTESANEIHAEQPSHFEYNPATFSFLNNGAWAVDLNIERHNNLSKYSNVTDTWQLPRNLKASTAFTDRLSKVTNDNLLTLIPASQGNFLDQHTDRRRTYELRLPSDLQFFRHLVVATHPNDVNDARHGLDKPRYVGLSHSDKGQNLRGVISMFERFEDAYQLLANKLWRDALRKFGRNDSEDVKTEREQVRRDEISVTEDKLFGLIPNSHEFLEAFAQRIQIDRKAANKHLRAALSDSLEYLVERSVLIQVHENRCNYCGHINERTLDELRKENVCSICKTNYFVPIDFSWKFKFNSFVTNSLVVRNGLTVLWALGHLHQSIFRGSFYFLPEANLYYEEDGNEKREEIDILSVGGGKFLIGEAKKSATSFLRKTGDIAKFVSKIDALKPDIALLVFENFAENPDEVEQVKIDLAKARDLILRETGMDRTRLSIVIAAETREFNEYDNNFGIDGPRLHKIYFS